jgi:hypothetical protein
MLGPPEFQYALSRATKIEIPAGLEDRVMAASLREYASLRELQGESTVIGRVGFTVKLQRLALAACVVFAVLVAIQMEHSKPRVVTTVTNTAMQESHLLSAEEEGYLLDDLNLGDYVYLANARELNFAELSFELNGLREDIELWQYGLLTE